MDRLKRKLRTKNKIISNRQFPRVIIFRSNKHLYLQAIDDKQKNILAASSTLKNPDLVKDFSEKLLKLKIRKIVFDRSGYQYHGRVKKIAEDLRKSGLEF